MLSLTVSASDFIYSTWIPDKYEGSQLINNNKKNKQCSDTQISSQFLDFLHSFIFGESQAFIEATVCLTKSVALTEFIFNNVVYDE